MSNAQNRGMLKLARRTAAAHGYSLSGEAEEALRWWVARLRGAGMAPGSISHRVKDLIGHMLPYGHLGMPLGIDAFNAAFGQVVGHGKSGGTERRRKLERETGTVERFLDEKGFGFIRPDSGGKTVFVHHSAIQGSGYVALAAGHRVVFDIVGDYGTAHNVVPLGGEVGSSGEGHGGGGGGSGSGGLGGSSPENVPPEDVPPGRREPPSAYALLDAPETVVAQKAFDAVVGLSDKQSAGVVGDALVLPPSTVYPYTLSLQLVAEGFELADGGALRREITATVDEPYPSTVVRLRALPQEEPVRARVLQMIYSIGGQTIGFAVRPVAVVRTAANRSDAPSPGPVPAVVIAVPTESTAPDLTIHILRSEETREHLLWTTDSLHPGVRALPDFGKPQTCDIGDQPREFAKQLVQQVNQQEGKKTLKLQMRGIGKKIAAKVPLPVWEAFHAAAAAAGGPPSVLIVSDEPYVPWELALVPAPLPDPGAPSFLGAQAHVGRWTFSQAVPPTPPHVLGVAKMAVVWGVYNSSKWARLEAAEEEAKTLRDEYGAESVDARLDSVLECLSGTPPAQALHFAIHGVYNPGGIQDGLVLTDDQTINPVQVSGADLAQHPLVFLNACQVGSAQEVLGDYAGMASAFLDARASAVIAPLWSVKDTIAKEISISFYREAFQGEPVAAVLRRQRAKYGQDDSATYLAYQYFGHPELRISRAPVFN